MKPVVDFATKCRRARRTGMGLMLLPIVIITLRGPDLAWWDIAIMTLCSFVGALFYWSGAVGDGG